MSHACAHPADVQPADLDLDGLRSRMSRHQGRLDELMRRYPIKRAALLQVLWLVQEEFGWIPRVGIRWAADMCAVSAVHAFGVVEFYTMYKQVPTGRFLIQVCQTMCCYLQGAEPLIEHLEKELGIHAGETTADGLFTLVRVECLALCGTGPGVMINDRAIGPETYESWPEGFHPGPQDLSRWIAKLRAESASQPRPPAFDSLGGLVLGTRGHPGAVGALAKTNQPGYAPAPPALKVAAAVNASAVTLTWANAPECTRLVIERSDDGGTSWKELAAVGPKDQKTTDSLPAGVTAHYRVIAHEGTRQAKPSATISAVGKPPAPPTPPSAPAASGPAPAPAKA